MENEFNPLHFTDCDGTTISLGDNIISIKGKNRGLETIFVFCIPQHRFGFLYWESYEKIKNGKENGAYDHDIMPEAYILDIPNLDFYYTPKSRMEIRKETDN